MLAMRCASYAATARRERVIIILITRDDCLLLIVMSSLLTPRRDCFDAAIYEKERDGRHVCYAYTMPMFVLRCATDEMADMPDYATMPPHERH